MSSTPQKAAPRRRSHLPPPGAAARQSVTPRRNKQPSRTSSTSYGEGLPQKMASKSEQGSNGDSGEEAVQGESVPSFHNSQPILSCLLEPIGNAPLTSIILFHVLEKL